MEKLSATMFEGVKQERSLIFLLSLTDTDMLRQTNFMKI